MSTVYQKIPNCFSLQNEAKKYQGEFADSRIEYLKDCQWLFTEKIDGQNMRIIWDGYKITYNGRTDNASLSGDVRQFMDGITKGIEPILEEMFREKPCVIYGEVYGGSVQRGKTVYSSDLKFSVFDVKVGEFWLDWTDVLDVAKTLNLEVVPYVLTGTIQDGLDWLKTHKESLIDGSTRGNEGLVGKPLVTLLNKKAERIIVKLKQEFLS